MSNETSQRRSDLAAQLRCLRAQGVKLNRELRQVHDVLEEEDGLRLVIAQQRRVIKDYAQLLQGSYKIRRDLLEKIKLLETRLASRRKK